MFWYNYLPQPIIFSLAAWPVHWYGVIMVSAILTGWLYALRAVNRPAIKSDKLDSLFFYLIIFGLIGARLGHVFFYSWEYFSQNLVEIFFIWQGGLSILGTIIAVMLVLYYWAKKHNLSFWSLADWLAPALALGQAIGRWGNYFNQELYGLPTAGWWGIPISIDNRLPGFEQYSHFHPTFFYESVLSLILFIIIWRLVKKTKNFSGLITAVYLIGYAIIRFSLEFIRLDPAPMILGLRWPQIYSLLLILMVIIFSLWRRHRN